MTTFDTVNIFPLLRSELPQLPPDVEFSLLSREFLGGAEPLLYEVLAQDTPDGYRFLPAGAANYSEDELFSIAYTNLTAIQHSYEVQNGVLYSSGRPYSSEQILLKPNLLKMHEHLQSDSILVGVPRRTTLIATTAENPAPEYFQNHGLIWYDDSHNNASIFEHMIRVDQGEIAAIAPVPSSIMEACAAAIKALHNE